MLPPKEEGGEAAHLLYPENYIPTAKTVPAQPSSDLETSDAKPKCPEEINQLLLPDDSSETSDPPETPQGETLTTLLIIDDSASGKCVDQPTPSAPPMESVGVVDFLQNLETAKTPEPIEMDDSIVRATFVDFAPDDESPPRQSTDEEDDDAKEFSLTLNPDLPKMRAQQIQNWLEFEKDQENGPDLNNNDSEVPGSESSSILEDSIEKAVPMISTDYDLDSLSEAGQLVREDTDGEGRRVRFLTDPDGNILISVYLTKLVTLLLTLLKLATAGFLDFTSSKLPPPPLPSSSGQSWGSFSESDTSDFACHYDNDETDSIQTNISGEGEEMEQHQIIPQSQVNGVQEGLLQKAIEAQSQELPKMELVDINNNSDDITHIEVTTNNPFQEEQEAPVRVIDGIKKVIHVDPSLTFQEDCEDDTGSDTETLSTSSCSSMIEVIPKDKQGEIQFVKDDENDGLDANNNVELKRETIYLDDPEIRDKSITCYEFQPEKEAISADNLPHGSTAISTDIALGDGVDSPVKDSQDFDKTETTLSALSVKNGDKSSGEVASSLLHEINSSEERKDTVDLLKFNPIIEQEGLTQPKSPNHYHSVVDVNNNSNGDYNNEIPQGNNYQQNQGELFDEDDPEKQLVSLCIEEEPISAVALTIAKWESFSKKQMQMEQSERSNIITKGKVHLQSYTNNPNINNVTVTTNNNNNNNPHPTQNNGHPQGQGKVVMSSPFPTSTKGLHSPSAAVQNAQQLAAAAVSAFNNNINNHNNNNTNGNNKTGPGWNCWTNNKTSTNNYDGNKTILEEEEAIYAQPNSQAGTMTTSLANPFSILKAYPKPNSKGEIINWFKEGEIHRSGILLSYGQTSHHSNPTGSNQPVTSPVIVSWFFGLITRQQAEELLLGQPTGAFLVRISTRIWGYTLSYQSNNKTKHFLISAINPAVPQTLTAGLEQGEGQNGANGAPAPPAPSGKKQLLFPFSPGGRYAFIGTNMTPYTTLTSLIRHHSHAPITKAGGEKLTIPCVGGPKIAGIEYVFK